MKNKELKTREEIMEECAYLNACDCLKFGYGKKYWHKCGIKGKKANEIWQRAKSDMAKDF